MTVEDQRIELAKKIASASEREYQAILDNQPRVGEKCPRCGCDVVSMFGTMREPPAWRRCRNVRCGWSREIM